MSSNNWSEFCLMAMKIAFTEDGQVNPNKSIDDIKKAISLFEKGIKLGSPEAWPYLKLADLVKDNNEKINLYKESIKIEPTIYAKAALYDLLIQKEKK